MDFHEPVFIGELVTLKAKLVYTSSRSMMVSVEVRAENALKKTYRTTNTAILWYAAVKVDEKKQRNCVEIPQYEPKTEQEKREFELAHQKYLERKEMIERER